jgi:hypothetical protein
MKNQAAPATEVRAIPARRQVIESELMAPICTLALHGAVRLAPRCADNPVPYASARTSPTLTLGPPKVSRWRRHLQESAWGIASLLCTFYVAWYASFS